MQPIVFDSGSKREGKTRFAVARADGPASDNMEVYPGETLAEITERAYGVNTPDYRAKLLNANANLKGTIRVPR